jgi:predicted lysophospholipase L1 biosynthesis ABC-type transport system permease subunit
MFLGPITDGEWGAQTNRVLDGWKQLANVVVLVSLVIAGGSLAVSVAGGLTERKRPFSMLRLTGVSLGTLRRVVALESVTPLLIAAAVALGAGLLTADLFLRAQMDLSLTMPGFAFYAIVGAGLVASLAIIASTLPLLRRITGPEVARNE